MERFWTVVAKIAALAIPVVGPLAVVHLDGWFNVSSPSGVLLATVVTGISVTGAVLSSR
jgi:hypothetical protein